MCRSALNQRAPGISLLQRLRCAPEGEIVSCTVLWSHVCNLCCASGGYGKPAQVITDRGSQFYANEKENARRDTATFETRLVGLGIRHVPARVRHPPPNGKLERFCLEMERHLKSFEEESASNTIRDVGPGDHTGNPFHAAGMADPMARLVDWYNDLPHMSLMDGKGTSAEAYVRKQAPKDTTAEEMGEDLHSKA